MKKGWVVLSTLLSIVICVCAYRMYATYTPVVTYAYTFDPLLSESAQHKITACLAQVTLLKNIHDLQAFVQATVPLVTTIHKQKRARNSYVFTFDAQQPCARTTGHMIITRNGKCVPESMYTHAVCAQLPCITLLTNDAASLKLCARWIATVPRSFFENYTIHWKNHTSLLLQDKTHPTVWIQCSTATLPANGQREQCITCNKEYTQKLAQHAICVCDIRFEKQIIVRPMMLGGA